MTSRPDKILERDIMDAQDERIKELEAIMQAALRVVVAWPYFRELTDYVEFEAALNDLCDLLGVPDDLATQPAATDQPATGAGNPAS